MALDNSDEWFLHHAHRGACSNRAGYIQTKSFQNSVISQVRWQSSCANLTNIVAVEGTIYARKRHRYEAITDIGQVQVQLRVWIDEAALV